MTENASGRTVIRFFLDASLVYNPSNQTQTWWYTIDSNGMDIPFQTIELNWNPQGHVGGLSADDAAYAAQLSGEAAQKFIQCHSAWGIPHFDVHFHTWSQSQVMSISDSTSSVANASFLPTDYQCPPFSFVPQMGFHCYNVSKSYSALEFSREPEMIYGSYASQVIFIEPMVAIDFLKSVRDTGGTRNVDIPQPSGQMPFTPFPTQVRFRYNENRDAFVIVMVF